jgi:hypothetical protein
VPLESDRRPLPDQATSFANSVISDLRASRTRVNLGKTFAVADNPISNCCRINAKRLADDGQRLTQRYPTTNLRCEFWCVDVLPRSIRPSRPPRSFLSRP